jgi:hypothetical protein
MLCSDLSIGNVYDEHPAAYENRDERRRLFDEFERNVAGCRSRLEQEFASTDPVVERWVYAVESLRFLIDGAYDGRYPTTHMGDSEEFSAAERAAELAAEGWEEALQGRSADDPA